MQLDEWAYLFEELRDVCIEDVRTLRGSGISVGHPITYGEITPVFVEQIIKELKLTPDDMFYDVGSGIGNVVLQVAAQVGCPSAGVEIRPELNNIARDMQERLCKYLKQQNYTVPIIKFHTGDALTDQFDFQDATVLFVNNWCFNSVLEIDLFKKFEKTLKEGERKCSLHNSPFLFFVENMK